MRFGISDKCVVAQNPCLDLKLSKEAVRWATVPRKVIFKVENGKILARNLSRV